MTTTILPDSFFRQLTDKETADFQAWARENHQPGEAINPLWHPVVRDECDAIDHHATHEPGSEWFSCPLCDDERGD